MNIPLCRSQVSTGLREERTRGSPMHFPLPKSPSCYLAKWLCLGSWMGTVVFTFSPPLWATKVSPLMWIPAGLLPDSWNGISLRLPLWTLISPASIWGQWPSIHFAVPLKSCILEPWVLSVCVSLTLSSSYPWSLERVFAPWNFLLLFPYPPLGKWREEQHSFWIYLLCPLSQVILSCSGPVSTGWGLGLRWWFSTWTESWLPFLTLAPSLQTYQGPFIHCCDLDPMQPSSPLETSLQLRTSILDMVDLISCSSSSPINSSLWCESCECLMKLSTMFQLTDDLGEWESKGE